MTDPLAAATAIARALVACRTYPAAGATSIGWWTDWFAAVLAIGAEPSTMAATVSAHGRSLTWSAWSERRTFVDGISDLLLQHATSEAELDRLYAVASRSRDLGWGAWATQRGDEFEGGWAVRGRIDRSLVAALIDDARDLATVETFAARFELDAASELARAVAKGAPSWDLTFPLAGAAPGPAWAALLDAFDQPAPSAAVRRLLEGAAAADAAVIVRLLPRGVGALAVRVAIRDPRDRIAALAAGAVTAEHDRPLAAFEGSLGVVGPRAVGFACGTDGPDVVLAYALPVA